MANAETRTIEQAVRPLALLEGPCDHPKLLAWDIPGASRDCEECHGTDKVAEFPMLRKPCPSCFGHGRTAGGAEAIAEGVIPAVIIYRPCQRCEAQGFVLVTTTDALLEAIRSIPGYGHLIFYGVGYVVLMVKDRVFPGKGFTDDEALALALSAAKGIEVK